MKAICKHPLLLFLFIFFWVCKREYQVNRWCKLLLAQLSVNLNMQYVQCVCSKVTRRRWWFPLSFIHTVIFLFFFCFLLMWLHLNAILTQVWFQKCAVSINPWICVNNPWASNNKVELPLSSWLSKAESECLTWRPHPNIWLNVHPQAVKSHQVFALSPLFPFFYPFLLLTTCVWPAWTSEAKRLRCLGDSDLSPWKHS